MSNTDDYKSKLDVLKAIPVEHLQTPVIPIDVYLQESENQYHWALDDLSELTKVGITQKVLNDLPVRAGACL